MSSSRIILDLFSFKIPRISQDLEEENLDFQVKCIFIFLARQSLVNLLRRFHCKKKVKHTDWLCFENARQDKLAAHPFGVGSKPSRRKAVRGYIPSSHGQTVFCRASRSLIREY